MQATIHGVTELDTTEQRSQHCHPHLLCVLEYEEGEFRIQLRIYVRQSERREDEVLKEKHVRADKQFIWKVETCTTSRE